MSNHKKKSKKSFYQKSKKFGKNGVYGQGKQLSEADYNFFLTILKNLNDKEFDEKDLIIQNFFKSFDTDKRIKDFVTNQVVSRLLDDIIPKAPIDEVIRFMNVLTKDLRLYCTNQFASHVLQTLSCLALKCCQKNYTVTKENENGEEETTPISAEQKLEFRSFLVQICMFVCNNLEEYIMDIYGSHIARTVIEICCGVAVSSRITGTPNSQTRHSILQDKKEPIEVPKEITPIAEAIHSKILSLSNFNDVISTNQSSAVVQAVLMALNLKAENDLCSSLINCVCEKGFKSLEKQDPDHTIHPLFEIPCAERLLEAALETGSKKDQINLYKLYFKTHFVELMSHPHGNFAIQKLFNTWKVHDSTYDEIFNYTENNLKVDLESKFTGVILAVVKSCRRLNYNQTKCLDILMNLYGCSSKSEEMIIFCILYGLKLSEYSAKLESNEKMPVTLHGSLIIQELLHFNKPIKIIRSFNHMGISNLTKIACDPRGSRIVDAFAAGAFVGEKSKEILIKKFTGEFVSLACNKLGSRSLEKLFEMANPKGKKAICSELVSSSDRLLGDKHGKFVYSKFQLRFINNESNWLEMVEEQEKKRRDLKNFLKEITKESAPMKRDIKQRESTVEESESMELDGHSKKRKNTEDSEVKPARKIKKSIITQDSEEKSTQKSRNTIDRRFRTKTIKNAIKTEEQPIKKKIKNKKGPIKTENV